jgi:hypothetical protein
VEQWFSIEVLDGSYSASLWVEAFGDSLTESALGFGALDWSWHSHAWGVVFEIRFEDEAAWDRWRESAPVQAALDGVPDPVSGLIVYKGRGGSAGRVEPRRPKPLRGSGAAALPLPVDEAVFDDWRTGYVLQALPA